MLRQTVVNLLHDIKDSLGLRSDITDKTISAYWSVLSRYVDDIGDKILNEIIRTWDKRYLPSPSYIAAIAGSWGEAKNDKQDNQKEENQDYDRMKDVYLVESKEFHNAIINDKPLTETQAAAKKQIDIYVGYTFGERDAKAELKKGKNPYSISYMALYRQFLSGTLRELTGIPKGNISIQPKKRKAYDEDYFKNFNFGDLPT
jgi:hypothetical protein